MSAATTTTQRWGGGGGGDTALNRDNYQSKDRYQHTFYAEGVRGGQHP